MTDDDLAPIIRAMEKLIDDRARTYHREGRIHDLHQDEPFDRRLASLYAQDHAIIDRLDIVDTRLRPLFEFHFNERLLDAVEDLIGPEITINPIEHIRPKIPAALTDDPNGYENVPWHQDAAVTWEEADESEIVTCWLPLVDATPENGCMRVIPGINRVGYLEHEASDMGTTIRPDVFPAHVEPMTAACGKGASVFMSRFTPHQGLMNRTDCVRWSLDLRYQPTGEPTGRPFFPAFVARSEADPDSVERDHDAWSRRWDEALPKARGIHWHRTLPPEQRVPPDSPFATGHDGIH